MLLLLLLLLLVLTMIVKMVEILAAKKEHVGVNVENFHHPHGNTINRGGNEKGATNKSSHKE